MNRQNKIGQEEMAGFVIIVILVTIIAVVLLGFALRKPIQTKTSQEVSAFIYASFPITTSCKPTEETSYTLKELIIACADNKVCLSGEASCEVLNKRYTRLIKDGFRIRNDSVYTGYHLVISDKRTNLAELTEGIAKSTKIGAKESFPYRDNNFDVSLELYS